MQFIEEKERKNHVGFVVFRAGSSFNSGNQSAIKDFFRMSTDCFYDMVHQIMPFSQFAPTDRAALTPPTSNQPIIKHLCTKYKVLLKS